MLPRTLDNSVHVTRETIMATKVSASNGETLVIEGLKPLTADDQAANVRVGLSFTKNLGNYQSAKFECTVSAPCHIDEIPVVTETLKDFVNKTVEEALNG